MPRWSLTLGSAMRAPLAISGELLDRLDLAQAVEAEVSEPITYLPSRVAESVAGSEEVEYADRLRARILTGATVEPPEITWAPKAAAGRYRPVAALTFEDRVTFRALVADLLLVLPPVDRSREARTAFEHGPLENESAAYVVATDVASFYSYVDHEELERQIVDQTAKADTALALRSLLQALFRRSFGLPQNYRPADRLADLILAPVERRLLRSGLDIYRFNDDFRIAAGTWGGAFHAIEILHAELDSVGLTVNEEKTWTLLRATYEANLGLVDRSFQTAFAVVQAEDQDIPEFDPYTGEPLEPVPAGDPEPDLDQVYAEAFETALEKRLSGDVSRTGLEAVALRRVLSSSLGQFIRTHSTEALRRGPELLAAEPSMTPLYTRYLQSLVSAAIPLDFSDQLTRTQEAFRGYIPPWPQSWLANAVIDPSVEISDDVERWLREFLTSEAPDALRVRAALPLARRGIVSVTELLRLFEEASTYARPDVVAAFGILPDRRDRRIAAAANSDPFLGHVFRHAEARGADITWL